MQESMLGGRFVSAERVEIYGNNHDRRHRKRESSAGCMSWLSHLLPRRRHGRSSSVTSPSWSDNDSDSNDATAAMTSCRDVTAGRRAVAVQQSMIDPPVPPPRSPVSAAAGAGDHVELFDVYYVLPPSSSTRRGPPPPAAASRWAWRDRRLGEFKCLLDAVPPTPGCYNDRRAATLPAEWSTLPHAGFEHYKVPAPPVSAMYSRPRCACLACSDLSPTSDVDGLYRHPTTTTWQHNDDDDDDVYYNSTDVDRRRRGCSCFGGTLPVSPAAGGPQGRPLRQGNPPYTPYVAGRCYGNSYDVVPTPLPTSYANVRQWRRGADETVGEPQYSVPVRLTDAADAIYDNQETLDRLRRQLDRDHRRRQVPVTSSDVGAGRIMRFVELRQVRAADERPDGEQPAGFRPYATQDRYLVAPSVLDDRPTAAAADQGPRRVDGTDVVYVNVEEATCQRTLSDPIAEEEDAEHCCPVSTGSGQEDHAGADGVERRGEEEQADEDGGVGCPAELRETKDGDDGTTARLKEDTGDESASSGRDRSRPRLRTPPDPGAAGACVPRLADAYLLRMSPPPPSHQTDGRRRAAYSDPVRWVSPVSEAAGSAQRLPAAETCIPSPSSATPRPAGGSSGGGLPNGLRPPPATTPGRTACTSEALDEAIRRRNRKCKPSAMRRLQAAKAAAGGGAGAPQTTDPLTFQPIFEGVTCSLRVRSASLSDCNALAKSRDQMINF